MSNVTALKVPELLNLSQDATCEISGIVELILKELPSDDHELWPVRTLLRRIDELNNLVMSVVFDHENVGVREAQRTVHGHAPTVHG